MPSNGEIATPVIIEIIFAICSAPGTACVGTAVLPSAFAAAPAARALSGRTATLRASTNPSKQGSRRFIVIFPRTGRRVGPRPFPSLPRV